MLYSYEAATSGPEEIVTVLAPARAGGEPPTVRRGDRPRELVVEGGEWIDRIVLGERGDDMAWTWSRRDAEDGPTRRELAIRHPGDLRGAALAHAVEGAPPDWIYREPRDGDVEYAAGTLATPVTSTTD